MRVAFLTLFWGSVGVGVYTYVVYPVLLFLLHLAVGAWDNLKFLVGREGRRLSDREGFEPAQLPSVSFLLAVRNEEEILSEKIENFLALDYPEDRMELLIGSDASGDRTVEIARGVGNPRIRVFDYRDRSGKIGVLKKLVPETKGGILIFSDANTFFEKDALRKLIRPFSDPNVGAVCGELRLQAPDGTLQSEGIYWRFETILKTLESRFGAVLGANGGIYAVRKELFPDIPADTIVEDFVIPLLVRGRGYRTPFEPEARAVERNPVDPRAEFRRRVRIGSGCAQAIPLISHLLEPRFGMVAFALWSHKMSRWGVPFAMLLAFGANVGLLFHSCSCVRNFYLALLLLQLLFYGLAAVGWFKHRRRKTQGVFGVPFFFLILNAALFVGFVRFWLGRHKVAWERTERLSNR